MWEIRWRESASRQLEKLDKSAQGEILRYLRERIASCEDPKRFGKPLRSNLKGLWRYRVRDYRIVCQVEQERLTVLVIGVGHRKDIYE